MNNDTIKIELIDWISRLNDQKVINKLLTLKKSLVLNTESKPKMFGSGKNLIEYISDDFNEPMEEF